MKKTGNVQRRRRFFSVAMALVLAMGLGLFADCFAIVSRADSQGKVTATSAKIRKEASVTSEMIGSVKQDTVITIKSQVQGSDGYVWYQTFVDSDTLGYIRSDLVQITDGTTPPGTTGNTTTGTTTPVTPSAPTAVVTAVNPVSGTVSGGASVRVRSDASTAAGSQIVKIVSNGTALTVTGTADGNDGKVWYQVSFMDNNTEIKGFIRSDYVTLSGELTPYVEEPEQPVETPSDTEPEEPAEPEVKKDFETALVEGKWYLIDNAQAVQYDIQGLFDKVTNNAEAYEKANKAAKTEKVIIVILVLLLVAAGAFIALLIFKLKDMMDSAYFNEVEKETLKRREPGRPQGNSGKVMHTVGAEKPATGRPQGQRPQGQRPAGAPQGERPQGQRPMGQRPAGAPQGERPQGQRPQGQRPAGAPQGERPQGQRPMGQRPAGAPQGERPQGQRPMGQKPAGAPQGERPQGQRPMGQKPAGAPQNGAAAPKNANGQEKWQSKNFMSDEDDEFEFEFLNYDGEEEQ